MPAATKLLRRHLRQLAGILGLLALIALLGGDARGDGVAQVMTAKSLPEATVAVIDPESGTSTGSSGSDVRIAVGDIILFRFAFTPVPDKINRGLQGYLTEYLPPNTELVGVRFIDQDGNTIEPRYPGIAIDGCQSGACASFNNLPCNDGADTCDFGAGSIAQVHADTGVFYSDDPRLAVLPTDQFITMDNGTIMNPEPRTISPGIVSLLGDTTGPYRVHNDWDWDQVRAFGVQGAASGNSGVGNTPFGYGSPVAGGDTHYPFEVTDEVGFGLEFNGVEGPWNRLVSPGSLTGTGTAPGSGTITRRVAETAAGHDLTPATSVDATAVRFALGETRTGQPGFVEVALRVTGVPLDPTFGAAGGNVDCGEVFGSDTSSRGGNSGAKDNPWPTYVGSPACVFLRLLFDLEVDKTLALGNDVLTYTLRGKNLSVDPETRAVARLKFDSSRQTFVAATPPADRIRTCLDDSTKQCIEWDLGTLAPSDEYVLEAELRVGGGGQTTNVMLASYTSDQLVAPGFTTQAVTIVTGIAVPDVTLRMVADPTTTFVTAGQNGAVTGAIANIGTETWSHSELTLVLPTGWTIQGTTTLGGVTIPCTTGCTTASPTFALNLSYTAGQSRTLAFQVRPPAGTAAGLYRIDVQVWGSQSGFGGSFETYFPKTVLVPVGAVRTRTPTIDCPVISTAQGITGDSEAGAAVRVLFNLMQRGTGTATGTGDWTVTNHTSFGEMYGGLEVRATAQVAGELVSEPSVACVVTGVKQCSDGLDNDGDGLIDFPADPGCTSPGDGAEIDPPRPQCSDGLDNNGSGGIDWPADPSCQGPTDPTENGQRACGDGIDNDGDGRVDFPADPDCTSVLDGTETRYLACQNGLDDDGDGLRDFPADPGCHSLFDDLELDTGSSTIDTKARLLLVFDSSGSMNWNTCADDFTGGDGSSECPGSPITCAVCDSDTCANSSADDSRLFKVKAGITDAVSAFGEVEYGLMRFHQQAAEFDCPGPAAGLRSGGWQGGGAAPCGGGFAAGDLLVSFAQENEQTLLSWIDGDSNYDGVAPVGTDLEIRGSGTTPLAGALLSARTYLGDVRAVDPKVACRPYRVILVTDGAETCGGNPSTAAAGLRTAGIPVSVIGFATPDPAVITNLDAIASAGGTSEAIFVDDEAALSAAIATIVTESILVEVCNGEDDDCDGRSDEDFPDLDQLCDNGERGACLEPGVRVCRADGVGTECDAPPGTPGTETCNGEDDDCDGRVDEAPATNCTCIPIAETCNGRDDDCDGRTDEAPLPGVGDSCGLDLGRCEPGNLICQAGALVCDGDVEPIAETCNTFDDDCDTFVDELAVVCYTPATGCPAVGACVGLCQRGVRTCTPQGTLGGCVGEVGPVAERCNGLDDDCDGLTDEAFPDLGDACDNEQDGVCHVEGEFVCLADGSDTVCTAPDIAPGLEICNGDDDDCDGDTDEELGDPIGDTCGGVAGCSTGTFACIDGEVVCDGSVGGSVEQCNGVDDDCDGRTDEAPLAGFGGDCTDPGFEDIGDVGACEFGTLVCAGGEPVCEGYVGPALEETCNGIDEDCDGVDDLIDAGCPGEGQLCRGDACIAPCQAGEFGCPFGYYCEELDEGRYCVPDLCALVDCPLGFACDRADGECRDLCADIECSDGRVCSRGLCLGCPDVPCLDDQICVANDQDVGVCQPDPCAGVDCDDGEFCRDGTCVAVTCDPACAPDQRCEAGQCVADPCASADCAPDQTCRPSDGECIADPCEDRSCSDGEACRPSDGVCIADPCATIECPAGFACEVTFEGGATCEVPPVPDRETIYTGGGGGCAATGGGDGGAGGAVVMLGLAGLVVMVRRRRPRRGAIDRG